MTGTVISLTPRPARKASPLTKRTSRAAVTMPIGRAVYTVAEVAELLSLSLGSTYALIRTGQIPAKKMGGRWVVPRRRFHAWLDELPEATDTDVERELRNFDCSGA